MSKKLNAKELEMINSLWMADWQWSSVGQRGDKSNAQRWFECVTQFLTSQGYIVYPPELAKSEQLLIAGGLSATYYETILGLLNVPENADHLERTLAVCMASPAERAEAIRIMNQGKLLR